MVLARSTPKVRRIWGANAQGRHFVSTDPRAILPSLCFNRVSSRRGNGFVGTRDLGLWFRRHTPPRLVLTSGERLRQRAPLGVRPEPAIESEGPSTPCPSWRSPIQRR